MFQLKRRTPRDKIGFIQKRTASKPNSIPPTAEKGAKMSPELKKLAEQWKMELTYRDGGAAAKKTWSKIKKIATAEQQVKLLEARHR